MLLNAASHELRTPLTPLSMHLERLARTTDQTETVERAQRCVRRISVTIDALLETAGLTRAATHPKVCRTEMLPLVRGAFAEATGPDDLMAYVDPALMEQAIGALVRIEVQDDGPGFAQDEGESWFMPLHRNVQDDRGGKAGLGLSIVRLVAMAHGGKAGVSSPGPGQGTTVWIELPREG